MADDNTTKPENSQAVAEIKPEVVKPTKKSNAGRPTKMTPEVYRKIEEAAALGASLEEIAFFAGIHRSTIYEWIKEDQELSDRIQELQEQPILKARKTIVNALDNPAQANWYLERKRKNEFATRSELTGANGEGLFKLEETEKQKLDDILNGKSREPIAIPAEPESRTAVDTGVEDTKPGSDANSNQWHTGPAEVPVQ